MKLLKMIISGLPLLESGTEINFTATQRVQEDDHAVLHHAFSNIYLQHSLAFVGVNASGKTTLLNAVSLGLRILNHRPINSGKKRSVLSGCEKTSYDIYFSHADEICRLSTEIVPGENGYEGEEHFVILDEALWIKKRKSDMSKGELFQFTEEHLHKRRNQGEDGEDYLPDDVSIIIAYNRTRKTYFPYADTSPTTNRNLFVLDDAPSAELLAFLDPSIEYLRPVRRPVDEGTKANLSWHLKFQSKPELTINSRQEVNNYLSSGTIKGITVFTFAATMLRVGGCLIIDELENHFNKEIALTLLRFFNESSVNPKGAVLLFSTHYPELLDEYTRNDPIYIMRNRGSITAESLASALKRNDRKRSEVYQSSALGGTAPSYETYMRLKDFFRGNVSKDAT